MKIHIFGASGSGQTTLGKALAKKLKVTYFDCDDYFWEKTTVPFTVRRDPEIRNTLLLNDLSAHTSWVIGGSMTKWGLQPEKIFNLAVFLYVPHNVRMERLKAREIERFGDSIFKERAELYKKFMDWASGYDDNTASGRTLSAHQNWIKQLNCEVLEINGDTTLSNRLQLIIAALTKTHHL